MRTFHRKAESREHESRPADSYLFPGQFRTDDHICAPINPPLRNSVRLSVFDCSLSRRPLRMYIKLGPDPGSAAGALLRCPGDCRRVVRGHIDPAYMSSSGNERVQRTDSISESNESFNSCNSYKQLRSSRLQSYISQNFVCIAYRFYQF